MDTKLTLGFSTFANCSLKENIDFAYKEGFSAISIDISPNPNIVFSEEDIQLLKSFSEKGNLILLHMPSYTPVSSSIDEIFEAVQDYFKKTIDFSVKIGAHSITFHTGYTEHFEDKKNKYYLLRNIRKIIEYANTKSVLLCVENDDKGSDYPLWKEEDILHVLENISALRFTLDFGHAHTANIDLIELFKKTQDKIEVMHLHNNHGEKDDHLVLLEGNIDYKSILQATLKKNAVYILEMLTMENALESKKLFEECTKMENKQ